MIDISSNEQPAIHVDLPPQKQVTCLIRSHQFLGAVSVLFIIGCTSPDRPPAATSYSQVEPLIAQNAKLTSALNAARGEVEKLNGELDRVRKITDEQRDNEFRLVAVKLGRFSGVKSWNDDPALDGVTLYVNLLDQHDDKIKRAGSIHIELFDLALAAEQKRIGSWDFTVDQAIEQWRSAAFVYGYVLKLPWQGTAPSSDHVTVRVVFNALDGRRFDAQRVLDVPNPAR